jgi:hypothetical protein
MLPDDVLLEIFDFYVDEDEALQAWQSLVRVCVRWRRVVFGSPNRLNLRLVCTPKTPVRDTLDLWPALPLLIQAGPHLEGGLNEIIAALERRDRVREISLDISSSDLENLSIAMQVPFPGLTNLSLWSNGEVVLPDSFLGGSAPRLQFLELVRIPSPGLPKLLFSATHLVNLNLWDIPHSGYISPEAMGTALSTLASLKSLALKFQSPLSCPDRAIRRLPPLTRSVLPVLEYFLFKGDNEYLDVLVAHIDAPRLFQLYIILFNDIVFYMPQFFKFICRTPLKALEDAHVTFGGVTAAVKLGSASYGELSVDISCRELGWQVSSLQQVCTSCLPPVSTLEDLYIEEGSSSRAHWQDKIENAVWLELLHPFRAVKNLYLSERFAPRIVPALQEPVGGRATEVLPTVQNIFLEGLEPSGPIQEGIGKFVVMRQITSQPIVVSRWD